MIFALTKSSGMKSLATWFRMYALSWIIPSLVFSYVVFTVFISVGDLSLCYFLVTLGNLWKTTSLHFAGHMLTLQHGTGGWVLLSISFELTEYLITSWKNFFKLYYSIFLATLPTELMFLLGLFSDSTSLHKLWCLHGKILLWNLQALRWWCVWSILLLDQSFFC